MYSMREYGVKVTFDDGRTFLVWSGDNLEIAKQVASEYTTAQILIRYVNYFEWGIYYA